MYAWAVEDKIGNVRFLGKTEKDAKTWLELHGDCKCTLLIKHYKMELISEKVVKCS